LQVKIIDGECAKIKDHIIEKAKGIVNGMGGFVDQIDNTMCYGGDIQGVVRGYIIGKDIKGEYGVFVDKVGEDQFLITMLNIEWSRN
jgi:hypothetical protein